jgi:hypothetical protein
MLQSASNVVNGAALLAPPQPRLATDSMIQTLQGFRECLLLEYLNSLECTKGWKQVGASWHSEERCEGEDAHSREDAHMAMEAPIQPATGRLRGERGNTPAGALKQKCEACIEPLRFSSGSALVFPD